MGKQDLTSSLKQRKPTTSARQAPLKTTPQKKARHAASSAAEAAPVSAVAASFDFDLTQAEHTLREFDLTSKFGPCTGMTRLARWERAQELGLTPPEEVHALLLSAEPPMQRCIWHARI